MTLEYYTAIGVTLQLVLAIVATWQRHHTTAEARRRRRKKLAKQHKKGNAR